MYVKTTPFIPALLHKSSDRSEEADILLLFEMLQHSLSQRRRDNQKCPRCQVIIKQEGIAASWKYGDADKI